MTSIQISLFLLTSMGGPFLDRFGMTGKPKSKEFCISRDESELFYCKPKVKNQSNQAPNPLGWNEKLQSPRQNYHVGLQIKGEGTLLASVGWTHLCCRNGIFSWLTSVFLCISPIFVSHP